MSKARYLSTESVLSKDGIEVKCRYLNMSEFDRNSEICQMLHYGFCLYANNVGYSTACMARRGLEEFITFIKWYNQEHSVAVQLQSLSGELTKPLIAFREYLKRRKININVISSLKNMLIKVRKYDESFSLILFPRLPQMEGIPNKSLIDSATNPTTLGYKPRANSIYETITVKKVRS
tara:strand:+ start:454 stop:987 length:534 start_codon:yes stop_codon:yes gene_type:complete